MANEYTLVELSKIEEDPRRAGVIDTLLMESSPMQMIPWETISSLATTITRLGTLPTVGFRKINEGYSVSTGALEQRVESISLMGGNFDTDKAIVRSRTKLSTARAITALMMTKAMAYKFNNKFINGNPETDPEEFKGLEERVNDLYDEGYTGQRVDVAGGSATEGILNSSAVSHNFLNKLDVSMYQIAGHNPQGGWMDSNVLLALRAILRKEGLLDETKNAMEQVVTSINGCQLLDIGVDADQKTQIIAENETLGGGTTESSIYFVKFGIGELLWGIQEYPLEVTDKGLLEGAPIYRTEVDWPLGLAIASPYCVSRLFGIIATNAA